jgi:hypothetical protein
MTASVHDAEAATAANRRPGCVGEADRFPDLQP